jgi:hypothetical protein
MENTELESMQKTLLELMVRLDVIEILCIDKKIFTAEEHAELTKAKLRQFAEVLAKKYNVPDLLDKIGTINPTKE